MLVEGIVYRGSSGLYSVRSHSGIDYQARLRGNIKKEFEYSTSSSRPKRVTRARKRRSTDPIAVGDIVTVNTQTCQIERIAPRKSELARLAPSSQEQHVLVANLDAVFVTVAAQNPEPNLWLLDRFLVAAEAPDLNAVIVVNKIDLAQNDVELRKKFEDYEKIGYRVFYMSASKKTGIQEFIAELPGTISAFTGPSGVGKSSLLNAIQPGLKLKTGEIGAVTNKGRHTTTTAELIPIETIDGAWIADTPGLRQMEFWDIPVEDIEYCFPEFEKYRGQCQFGDCAHSAEPGCAVREAAERKEIDMRRYRSYLNMIAPNRESLSAGERA